MVITNEAFADEVISKLIGSRRRARAVIWDQIETIMMAEKLGERIARAERVMIVRDAMIALGSAECVGIARAVLGAHDQSRGIAATAVLGMFGIEEP